MSFNLVLLTLAIRSFPSTDEDEGIVSNTTHKSIFTFILMAIWGLPFGDRPLTK